MSAILLPCCGFLWYLDEKRAHSDAERQSRMKSDTRGTLPPYFNIDPDAAAAGLGDPADTRTFGITAEACAAGPGGPRVPRARDGWQAQRADVLHLGDHPLPDPRRPGHFRRVLKREPRPAAGPLRDRGRRQVVHPRRGAAPARRISAPRGRRPRSTCPTAPRGCRPRWWRWRTSRAASARPRPRRIWRCRRRSTATGCW